MGLERLSATAIARPVSTGYSLRRNPEPLPVLSGQGEPVLGEGARFRPAASSATDTNKRKMNAYIRVTAHLVDAGEAVGPPVIEYIPLARVLTELAEGLARQDGSLGSVLKSMISCAILDDAVFEAALAAIGSEEDGCGSE
jgi:hypothetical protein